MQPITRDSLLKLPMSYRQNKTHVICNQIYDEVIRAAQLGETKLVYYCDTVDIIANDNYRSPIPTMEEIISELKKYIIDCTITTESTNIYIDWDQNEMCN